MRRATVPLTEITALAGTRGMLGAGAALLLAGKLRPKRRRMIGWPLLVVGAVTTVPLMIDVLRKSKRC